MNLKDTIAGERVNSRESVKTPIIFNRNDFLEQMCAIVMAEIADSKIIWQGSEIVFQERLKNRFRKLVPDHVEGRVRTCALCGHSWTMARIQAPRGD